MTNWEIDNRDKAQIFISGEVHGDEIVGPTATLELLELILKNKKNPWFEYLLNTRYIVIIPMANPYGYKSKLRVKKFLLSF